MIHSDEMKNIYIGHLEIFKVSALKFEDRLLLLVITYLLNSWCIRKRVPFYLFTYKRFEINNDRKFTDLA